MGPNIAGPPTSPPTTPLYGKPKLYKEGLGPWVSHDNKAWQAYELTPVHGVVSPDLYYPCLQAAGPTFFKGAP